MISHVIKILSRGGGVVKGRIGAVGDNMVTPGDAAGSAPDHMKAGVAVKRVP